MLPLNLLFFLLPFSQIMRYELYPHIFFRLLDLSVFLALIYLVFKKPKINWLKAKSLIIFSLILVISFLVNFEYYNLPGLAYLARTLLYLNFSWLFLQTEPLNQKMFSISLILVLIFGFIQYFLYPDLRNLYYLGYDPHYYRMFGLTLDPNIFGLILIFSFFLILEKPFFLYKILNYFYLFLVVIAIALTFSRTAYFLFVICGVFYFLNICKNRVLIFIFGGLLFLSIILVPKQFGEGNNLFRVNSLAGKINSGKKVLKIFTKKPFLGVGFNNLNLKKDVLQTTIDVQIATDNARFGLDNSLFTVLATTGIIGTVIYFFCFYSFWVNINTKLGKVIVLAFFIHSLSVNSFFTPELFLYFLGFYSLANTKTKKAY